MSNKKTPRFKAVNPQIKFPDLEKEVLQYWKENKTFEKSIESRPEDKKWTFLDGPPFVTGMPHYGHLLGSIHKDLFGRYWTMKGYRVRRVWGWDGHGLPIENKVENKLGITRKKDIEEVVGVDKFIEECKKYVEEISGEWEWYVDHIGRWVDFENAYKTWDKNYMESVMWVFKQMYDGGHIYKGMRVSLYCPHCSTPISNFEVAMDADNYQELTEPANTYKYKVVGQEDTYFLAWSTTPWNKIVTSALAVNPDISYVKVKQGNEFYILAESTTKMIKDEPKWEVVEKVKGRDLVGMSFEPHYDFFPIEEGKQAFVVIPGDFVSAEDGTGIVTIAAYGEDDMKAINENNIQVILHLDEEGHVLPNVPNWGGMYYLKVNKLVNEDLEKRGLMYKEDQYTHTVPTCWRCHTRLYYAPLDAWFVNVQNLKPLMKKTNEEIYWFPHHFKHGRFLKSLENAPDWNISRNRYWGSPIPVWECECGERFVPGSIKELEEASGKKISDLHKPEIDEVTVKCKKCGKEAHRVPEVLDSWIEAGSASFAERHYPFEGDEKLEDFFPPDFIAEYTGQIRAWFYVLHVIGAALYKSKAFKNVGVEGVVQGTDGRKMSKNLGNYPDPKEMLDLHGGDALRLYLMGSTLMKGEDLAISEEDYKQQVRGFMLIFWNVYNYFVTYANVDSWIPSNQAKSDNILDKWINILLSQLIIDVTERLEAYDPAAAVTDLKEFVSHLSLWYVRRSRDRDDKENFYSTIHSVITTYSLLLAPVAPFISEEIYRNLTGEESVHLADWPTASELSEEDKEVLQNMSYVRQVVEAGHSERKKHQIAVRQPLSLITVTAPFDLDDEYLELIKEELNIKTVKLLNGKDLSVELDTNITPELEEEAKARELIREIQQKRKELNADIEQKIDIKTEWIPENEELKNKVIQKTLVNNWEKGVFEVVLLN